MSTPDESDERGRALSTFLGYLVYGVVACVVVLVPWMATEELFKRIPGGATLKAWLRSLELSGPLEWMLAVVTVACALAAVGWLIRRFLWSWLERVPILRSVVSGLERFSDQLRGGGPPARDLVVWVAWPNEQMQTLGLVTGQVPGPGTEAPWLTVVLLTTAGQIKGGSLRIIDPALATYPGWTVDQALAFVNSSGRLAGAPPA